MNKNIKKLAKALNISTSNLTIAGLGDTIEWAKSFEWKNEEHTLLANNIVYYPEWLSVNILPRYLKESIWKDIKGPLNTLKSKRSIEQIESELWKETDPDYFERMCIKFAHHIEWVTYMRGTDPQTFLEKGCPELAEWWSKLNIQYRQELEDINAGKEI